MKSIRVHTLVRVASRTISGLAVASVCLSPIAAQAQSGQYSLPTHHVRQVVIDGTAPVIGGLPSTLRLNLSIVLPLRNQDELTNLLDRLNDPSSPDYHQFLSVSQFTERFGPTVDDYQAVVNWAQDKGFAVADPPANRLLVNINGTVAQIDKAFNLSMKSYRHPTESRAFFAPDREPTVDINVPLWHIAGLDDYSIPRPAMAKAKKKLDVANLSGSGPYSLFLPGDMRAAYYGSTALTGSGQCVGLAEFGGYNISDVALTFDGAATYTINGTNYTLSYTTGGVKYSIPVNNVALNGYTVGDSGDVGEQALDIAAAIGMAPGLSQVRVYTVPNDFTTSGSYVFPANSGDTVIFNQMASDDSCAQLSISWNWAPEDIATNDGIFEELEMQGQNLFAASGDNGSWPNGGYYYPEEDAYLTAVGGTVLTTNGAGGPWESEIAWGGANTSCAAGTGSGGGISPNGVPIPNYQQLPGVIDSSNKGSTALRNVPDVAAQADCANYYCYQGVCSANTEGAEGGTSYAAPRWAGFLALVNQQLEPAKVGPLNNLIYPIGVGSGYDSDFHDIKVGDNFDSHNPSSYPAVTGYDLVTGWGSPNGQDLIEALKMPATATPQIVSITVGTDGGGPSGTNYVFTFNISDSTSGAVIHYSITACGDAPVERSESPGQYVYTCTGHSSNASANIYALAPGYGLSSTITADF